MRPMNRSVSSPGRPAVAMRPCTWRPLARTTVNVSFAGADRRKRTFVPRTEATIALPWRAARNAFGLSDRPESFSAAATGPGAVVVAGAGPAAGGDGAWLMFTSAGPYA